MLGMRKVPFERDFNGAFAFITGINVTSPVIC